MNTIRTNHWVITGTLFAIAVVLYIAGSVIGAAMIFFLGFIVESAAWISLALHPREGPSSEAKE